MDFHKLRQQLAEATNSTTDHVTASYDYMPNHNKPVSRKEVLDHAQQHGGKSIKVTNTYQGAGGGGSAEVHIKGHVKHVMKFINHHHDENYSHDHAGHKKFKKDFG